MGQAVEASRVFAEGGVAAFADVGEDGADDHVDLGGVGAALFDGFDGRLCRFA